MRRFIKSESGTITLYFLIIFLVMYFFCGILIDYARIMAARRTVQAATQAGVRSVMACYDDKLPDYGLYGVKIGAWEQDDLYQTVVERHLYGSDYMILDLKLEAGDIDNNDVPTLGHHDWFEQQIFEDMKYKAPIEMSENILKIFNVIKTDNKSNSLIGRLTDAQYGDEDAWNDQLGLVAKDDESESDSDDENEANTDIEDRKQELSDAEKDLKAQYTRFFGNLVSRLADEVKFYIDLLSCRGRYADYNGIKDSNSLLGDLVDIYWNFQPAGKISKSIDATVNLFKNLRDAAIGLASDNHADFYRLYVNEYAFLNFECVTDAEVENGEVPRPEIEYIIYGNNWGFHLNAINAFNDIAAVRLAINYVFGPPPQDLEPFSRLIIALVQTAADMVLLCNGQDVCFIPKYSASGYGMKDIKLGYDDYLRLFMLGVNNGQKLVRIQSLIDARTGRDLTQRPVVVTGNTEVSVKLTFIPAAIKVLNIGGIFENKLDEENRYVIRCTASSYY